MAQSKLLEYPSELEDSDEECSEVQTMIPLEDAPHVKDDAILIGSSDDEKCDALLGPSSSPASRTTVPEFVLEAMHAAHEGPRNRQ